MTETSLEKGGPEGTIQIAGEKALFYMVERGLRVVPPRWLSRRRRRDRL